MTSELRNFRAEIDDEGEHWNIVADGTSQSGGRKTFQCASGLDEPTARGMAAWEDLLVALMLIRDSLKSQNNAVSLCITTWANAAIAKATAALPHTGTGEG